MNPVKDGDDNINRIEEDSIMRIVREKHQTAEEVLEDRRHYVVSV